MRARNTARRARALALIGAAWLASCNSTAHDAPQIAKITVPPPPAEPVTEPEPTPAAAPAQATPPAAEPEADAPTNVHGSTANITAVATQGTITVRFWVHDPCDTTRPRVAIDLDARSIAIQHKNRAMRCGGDTIDYKTVIEGLPAGIFEVSAPGLPRTRVRVPSAAAVVEPKARSIDVSPKRAPREVLDEF